MKVSLQWLTKYVDLSGISTDQIADALPMLGLEVESVSSVGLPALSHVVVGEILSFEKHPKADRLNVCQVDTGDGTPRQIVCGAKNFQAHDRVPVALPGAVLPGGFEIKVSKLRDVDSLGMMCSAKELGLGDDHGGLLILTARQLPIGSPLNDHFPLPDSVFEIAVTANRGDALSHIGVARDLAAFFNKTLKLPSLSADAPDASAPPADSLLSALNVTAAASPYYTAWSLRGVRVTASPDWLQRDLESVGLRPINNIVDVTNWVMLETGQPLHAFDASKIAGRTLNIRNASAGEKITLLDGKTVALEESDCVIADAVKPLVIAGVMGGEDCGVSNATTDIVLESAWFSPAAVRKTSRRVAVNTDSSQRFTRDVDPAMVRFAARRAIDLILQTAGGTLAGPRIVAGAPPRGDRTIAIRSDFVRARCGYAVDDATILDVFRRLGFSVAVIPDGTAAIWHVTVPSFRPEVDRPVDLVEEFVRIHGTESIPATAIAAPTLPAADAPVTRFTRRANALLGGQGFAECWHYTLTEEKTIARFHGKALADALALANPLTSDQSHVRPSLLPGLLGALQLNLAGHNQPRRLFETGRVFRPGRDGALRELTAIAFVVLAEPVAPSWKKREPVDFFYAKKLALEVAALAGIAPQRLLFKPASDNGDVTAPFWQSGHAATAADRAGHAQIDCGLVDAKVTQERDIKTTLVAGEILLTQDNFASPPKRPRFQDWSPFPPVAKDVSVVVDAALSAAEVLDKVRGAAVKAAGKEFAVENITCFDVYAGTGLPEGKKSLAFSITFRAPDKTLTDDAANKAFEQILSSLEKGAKYQVRR
ncbi:MAG: phenylalanine--tRNA ligase subunit beta [Puniceicoccales bacterium]|jgi:phenylalanyl-tRNA synthetase beta chain|nr:phenylalanine--tRNA ligase subunit beta [Puniceicoccales bacterium]